MTTASALKKENIAEYLLYMWQIENLIRAYGLDIDRIEKELVDRYPGLDDRGRRELLGWYESLVDMMRREEKATSGHLQINTNTLDSLRELHRKLLASPGFPAYAGEYYKTLPFIVELRAKAGDNPKDEIETCFDALYGLMMLRLQKKEVTDETARAAAQISKFIATLAAYYKKDYNNELEFTE